MPGPDQLPIQEPTRERSVGLRPQPSDHRWGEPMTRSHQLRQAVHYEEDNMTLTTPDQLLNAKEAANYLRMSLPWVRLRTADGTLPHSRLGRRIVYSRAALDRFVAENSAPRPYRTRG